MTSLLKAPPYNIRLLTNRQMSTDCLLNGIQRVYFSWCLSDFIDVISAILINILMSFKGRTRVKLFASVYQVNLAGLIS